MAKRSSGLGRGLDAIFLDNSLEETTAGGENSSRGNKAYGESDSFFNPSVVSNGTYDLRGDVARLVVIDRTRYGIAVSCIVDPQHKAAVAVDVAAECAH